MPNRKISELTLATSSLPTDGLVIQRGGSNFKLEASNFSTNSGDTGSLVTTSSISGTTITFTKGDGSTYTNEIVSASYAITASHEVVHEVSSSYAETSSYAVSASVAQLALEAISSSYAISASHAEVSDEAISASYAITASHATSTAGTLSNGTSVDAFSFDGSTDVTVDISTYSASVSTDRTNLSASLTTTDQTISSSVASLSGSASDARNQLAADYIAADTALSSSLTTTDQTISASVATLSGSASDARNQLATDYIAADTALSASLTTTDQTISASVATLSGSASDARNQLKTDLTVSGTDGQTIRYEGTTQVANSVLFNSGSQVSIGNTSPKAGYSLSVANQDNAFDHRMLVGSPTVGGTQDYLELRSTGTTGYLEAKNDLMISASHDGNTADITVRTNRNIILSASNGAVYNASKQIKDLADPTVAQDAATKNYVDTSTANSNYVAVTGDTMTGKLVADQGASSDEGINIRANSGVEPALGFLQDTIAQSFLVSEQASPYALRYTTGDKTTLRNIKAADPVDSDDLATKNYADSNFVELSGDTMTGALILNANPTASLGAATKQYADNLIYTVPVMFSGFGSGSSGNYSAGSKVAFSVDVDTNSAWSDDTYTIPEDGVYEIITSLRTRIETDDRRSAIFKGTGHIRIIENPQGATGGAYRSRTGIGHIITSLVTGDTISVGAFQTTTNYPNISENGLSIRKLRN